MKGLISRDTLFISRAEGIDPCPIETCATGVRTYRRIRPRRPCRGQPARRRGVSPASISSPIPLMVFLQLTLTRNGLLSFLSARGEPSLASGATRDTRYGEELVTRTSKRLTARAAARQRQAKANEDQHRREHTELEHATEFEVARMRRDGAAATVAQHEMAMARQVQTLLALGNPMARIAELTGDTEAEIKRLRKLLDNDPNHAKRPHAGSPGGRRHRSPSTGTASTGAERLASTNPAAGSPTASASDARDPHPLTETGSPPSSD